MTDTTTRDIDPGPWCATCERPRAEVTDGKCPSCDDRPVRMDSLAPTAHMRSRECQTADTPSDRLPRSATTPTESSAASTGSASVEADSATRLTPLPIARRWMNL